MCGTTFKKMSAFLNHTRVKNACVLNLTIDINDTKGKLQSFMSKNGTLNSGDIMEYNISYE